SACSPYDWRRLATPVEARNHSQTTRTIHLPQSMVRGAKRRLIAVGSKVLAAVQVWISRPDPSLPSCNPATRVRSLLRCTSRLLAQGGHPRRCSKLRLLLRVQQTRKLTHFHRRSLALLTQHCPKASLCSKRCDLIFCPRLLHLQ